MKQFYEVYSGKEIVSSVMTLLQTTEKEATKFVSSAMTQIQSSKNKEYIKVSPMVS